MMPRLAWSAIVRNEAANLPRCIASLLPHIDAAVVVDTGSTDGSPELIRRLFAEAGKPAEVHEGVPFHDFSQARNEALRRAWESPLPGDYLVLCDADMELKIDDPSWKAKLNGGPSYDMRQVAGGNLSYYNRRLVNRAATGNYVGVTHEYLDVDSAGAIDGAYFIDHADGANRPEKYARDIHLLEEALKTETREGMRQRYTFYLAQTYFDSKNWAQAAALYKQRAAMGGFEEECWNAQVHYAHCLENMGNKEGFLWEMLQAYKMRPGRAETMYDLAKWFRERGENHTSLLFSEAGLQTPYPKDDMLFVADGVYNAGLKEEFSICAYYDPARRKRGARVCDEVALSAKATEHARAQARANMFWYLEPLAQHVPSFKPERIAFDPPAGWAAMNPSVINRDGHPLILVRTVNYTISPQGSYMVGDRSCDVEPIRTRNFMCSVWSTFELGLPRSWPEPQYSMVRGLEDSRLFVWNDELWTISTARELNPQGWCEQVLAPIVEGSYGQCWKRILPVERRNEKNWQPIVDEGQLGFMYRQGVLIDVNGEIITRHPTSGLDTGHLSGGSQVIEAEGNWLSLVHEAGMVPGRQVRCYAHRFMRYDAEGKVIGISPPFYFQDKQIEFAAGLAYFPERRQLMASYGVRDAEAWTATMDLAEVLAFIEEVR